MKIWRSRELLSFLPTVQIYLRYPSAFHLSRFRVVRHVWPGSDPEMCGSWEVIWVFVRSESVRAGFKNEVEVCSL